MAAPLRFTLPRLVVVALIGLLATATLTFAADTGQVAPTPAPAPVPAPPAVLVVPDVRGQAYVFAKGTLEDAGFAWRLRGGAAGYSANAVASQQPAPGTRVLDTGAPTITLTLVRNGQYPERGAPASESPYRGTPIRLADLAAAEPARKPAAAKAPAKTPAPKTAAPAKKPTPPAKDAQKRPPAFAVPGGRPEPLDEMPLPDRARLLNTWLAKHRTPTDANVSHWLYQHSWIVTGAKLGWWRGAEALQVLIQVDERVQAQWGIGAESEALARAALAEVEARAR